MERWEHVFLGFETGFPPQSEFRQKSDLRTRRCPISETEKKKVKKGPAQIPPTRKGKNPWDSGPTPVARGGSGAGAPALAARPTVLLPAWTTSLAHD